MASLKEITILEGKTGFLKTRLEKVYRLLEILKEISLHPLLSKALALKGGTAINLFLFDCPRLSIDLDFNFIGADSKDETDKTILSHGNLKSIRSRLKNCMPQNASLFLTA